MASLKNLSVTVTNETPTEENVMSLKSITIPLNQTNTSAKKWQKEDTVWMLSLYGTAVGAGTLFLPINAGLHGIWPLIIMLILAFPMTFFSHQALCRFVLSGSKNNDITEVVNEHFGDIAGKFITLLYFFAIFPILLMYSVAITNTTQSFIVNQLKLSAAPRALLSILLICALMMIIRFGKHTIVKSMSVLVYPFVTILLFLSLYLISHWNTAIFTSTNVANGQSPSFWMTMWLIIPVMVFSFNHSPIISSFAVSQKETYGNMAEKKSSWILRNSHLMMVATVMFFCFSCVFSLSPADLMAAKAQNISILSYLANHFKTPLIAYIAPLIAFIAIAKSFFGHYLGASEGLHGLFVNYFRYRGQEINESKLKYIIEIIIVGCCWLVATLNPSILGMIETLGGPVIAMILFLMPMYAILKVPAMQKYRYPIVKNIFVILIGLTAISAILYGFLLN